MFDQSKDFQQLKTLLEGKTILKIEEPHVAEAICKFVMADGTAFRLHATDLGYWIEETVSGAQGYQSLDALINDYYHHTYGTAWNSSGDVSPDFNNDGKILTFSAPDGKHFDIAISRLTETETNIINNNKALYHLLDAFCLGGGIWMSQFSPRQGPDLPANCYIELENK